MPESDLRSLGKVGRIGLNGRRLYATLVAVGHDEL